MSIHSYIQDRISGLEKKFLIFSGSRHDCNAVGLQLLVQSVPNTTKVVSLNPTHVEVYSIQLNVIKFISDLQQVCGFLWVLRFPPPIKLTRHKITEILLQVALNTITLTLSNNF